MYIHTQTFIYIYSQLAIKRISSDQTKSSSYQNSLYQKHKSTKFIQRRFERKFKFL